jgi:hypothetical protein
MPWLLKVFLVALLIAVVLGAVELGLVLLFGESGSKPAAERRAPYLDDDHDQSVVMTRVMNEQRRDW